MKRSLVWLALLSSVLAIGLSACGGNDDEDAGTTGETTGAAEDAGGAAEEYVDGACVAKSQRSELPIPEVVDCDDPKAVGVLRETEDFNKCEGGDGFYLGVLEGEEINKDFCVEPQ